MHDRRKPLAPRKAVNLTVKVAHRGVDEFVEKYATNISVGGFFIRTREPQPLGTEVSFKVELAQGQRVLQGTATVRWVRGANHPEGPQGMGLEFRELDAASAALVKRILAGPTQASRAPPPPAVAPVPPPPGPAARPPRAAASAPVSAEKLELDSDERLGVPKVAAERAADLEGGVELPRLSPEEAVDLDLATLLADTPEPVPPAAAAPAALSEHDLFAELNAPQPPPPLPRQEAKRAPQAPAPPLRPRPQLLEEAAGPRPLAELVASATPVFLKPPAELDPQGLIVGIDLGTTNSCCAVLQNGKAKILFSKDGYNVIPSVVALTKQGGLLVGQRAKSQLLLNPSQSVYGAKRLVGRDYSSPTVQAVRERFHYQIVPGVSGKAAVALGGHVLSMEEVQGIVLQECREIAEAQLGAKVTRAVITCPAYYSEQQREAVRRAAAMAGLKAERVLNEPTAAALAYGMNRGLTRKVLVYDLGGGTFDVTILRIDDNAFEVLATGGDIFLGGLDFDNQVVDALLRKFEAQHGRAFEGDAVALSRVAAEAERVKVALSERAQVEVHLPMLAMSAQGKPLDLKVTVARDELNQWCGALVDRTIDTVQDVLLDAKLKITELDDIILVGGMSRMPLVRERIKQISGKPPRASVNADEAVAVGAALFTSTVDKVSNVTLIDVVPMTLGIGLPGGGFRRVIERNTALPAVTSFGLVTTRDAEDHLELSLFQGEDQQAMGNEYVSTVRIEGLPRAPKGTVQVAVSIRLDAECVLRVEAREMRTRALLPVSTANRYSADELRTKLGVTSATPTVEQDKRSAELASRGGKFWGFLKRVVGRA